VRGVCRQASDHHKPISFLSTIVTRSEGARGLVCEICSELHFRGGVRGVDEETFNRAVSAVSVGIDGACPRSLLVQCCHASSGSVWCSFCRQSSRLDLLGRGREAGLGGAM
jgi:hypothetical protein